MVTPVQIKMARAALGWSTRDLARHAEVHHNTVARIERGETATKGTLLLLKTTLESAGVEFTNGDAPGVRLRPRD